MTDERCVMCQSPLLPGRDDPKVEPVEKHHVRCRRVPAQPTAPRGNRGTNRGRGR